MRVYMDVIGFSGRLIKTLSREYDGTADGAMEAARALKGEATRFDCSELDCLLGADGPDGEPRFAMTPTLGRFIEPAELSGFWLSSNRSI